MAREEGNCHDKGSAFGSSEIRGAMACHCLHHENPWLASAEGETGKIWEEMRTATAGSGHQVKETSVMRVNALFQRRSKGDRFRTARQSPITLIIRV